MRNCCLFILAVFAFAGFANAQDGEGKSKLSQVTKIYVSELGRTDDADIIHEKIKLRLAKTGQYSVVDRAEKADAVLTGTVVISQQIDGDFDDIETKNKGVAVFYLRDAETDETLWTYEFKPKFFNIAILTDKATRGYNQVANRTVERLLKDAGHKGK